MMFYKYAQILMLFSFSTFLPKFAHFFGNENFSCYFAIFGGFKAMRHLRKWLNKNSSEKTWKPKRNWVKRIVNRRCYCFRQTIFSTMKMYLTKAQKYHHIVVLENRKKLEKNLLNNIKPFFVMSMTTNFKKSILSFAGIRTHDKQHSTRWIRHWLNLSLITQNPQFSTIFHI